MPKLRPLIGLDQIYYAVMTQDDSGGVAYNTPVPLKGAVKVSYNPNSTIITKFADDGPAIVEDTTGEHDIEVEILDYTLEDEATLGGHTIANGVMVKKPTDVSPDVAFGFRAKRSGGHYSYFWFLKGKLAKPSLEFMTREAQTSYNTPKLIAKFVQREYDGQYVIISRSDAVGYQASTGTNWFSAVQSFSADTTAPTISSTVPANSATGVAVGSTFVWNFSEAIQQACINAGNFFVINNTTGAQIAGTLTYNAAQTQVTFTPGSNLAAATAHRAFATRGVKDMAGNALAAISVTNFTTA